ncbi:hypothetical protein CBR_g3643 [Chara braunii]|uniref:FHA domain-containing protein n=1 Tax=Chara braunii TaxID=69332 RepID=A0A388KFW3_CHABU|nr:hypothetical protein CBR_g3643 [Chara braunii]|eukprot:GBG68944.1 hypothetical protein CBR_g3643 [Chara braunii]
MFDWSARRAVERDPDEYLPVGYPISGYCDHAGGSTIGRIDVGLKSSYLIGRATGCDIVLDHASVSRQHALLVHHHTGKMMIKDLGSAHGTVVDGQRLRTGTWLELCEGSVVRFGASTKSYVARGRDLSHFLL